MIRIGHIISGLGMGGAEATLYKVLSNIDGRRFESRVISLTGDGPIGERIRALGVPVWSLGMRRGVPDPGALLGLSRWLRHNRCEVIQTWMYHADLLGGLVNRQTTNTPVIWNIRHGNPETHPKLSTRWTVGACALLSRSVPAKIVCCSEIARELHRRRGYEDGKMVVIPNGFDLDLFRPDSEARAEVRAELGIPQSVVLIGRIGRFHPQKDHKTFVQAAGVILERVPDARFLLCGDGVTWQNESLTRWIDEAGIRQHCYLTGPRPDIHRINAALDLAVSSSCSEGFPNVVGEAMACGVPCVATEAGDTAYVVGNPNLVVPVRNAPALAQACIQVLRVSRSKRLRLGDDARRRIRERFSLASAVARYEQLYDEVGSDQVRGDQADLASHA